MGPGSGVCSLACLPPVHHCRVAADLPRICRGQRASPPLCPTTSPCKASPLGLLHFLTKHKFDLKIKKISFGFAKNHVSIKYGYGYDYGYPSLHSTAQPCPNGVVTLISARRRSSPASTAINMYECILKI